MWPEAEEHNADRQLSHEQISRQVKTISSLPSWKTLKSLFKAKRKKEVTDLLCELKGKQTACKWVTKGLFHSEFECSCFSNWIKSHKNNVHNKKFYFSYNFHVHWRLVESLSLLSDYRTFFIAFSRFLFWREEFKHVTQYKCSLHVWLNVYAHN